MPSAAGSALLVYDLPVLVAALANRKRLLVNPVDATNPGISPERAQIIYGKAAAKTS
ncbi:hypothetical protein [Larkinella insperata]|nr:hypothetical protein [Larkinella insperata]